MRPLYPMSCNNETLQTCWIEGAIPFSRHFSDVYYSRSDGRAETRYVFINGNHLPERWTNMKHCTIAELGFGTGLNFLETVHQWKRFKAPGTRLYFIAYEQFPLHAHDMRQALSRWSELDKLAECLCQQWHIDGEVFDLQFSEDIFLRIYFSDANIALPKLDTMIDAWYLDGFSPDKNPELWNASLLRTVFETTRIGGTFATYCAAGFVRRNLQEAGFTVSRLKGFGTKREMLAGYKKPEEKNK